MKKLIAVILTVVLALSCSTVCFAAEESDAYTVDVYAKFIGGSDKTEAPIPDGADDITVKLPDGTDVILENIPDGAKKLVIFPIPDEEEEALTWFKDVTKDNGSEPAPYEIYFIDSNGDKTLPNGTEITMAVPDGVDQPVVLAVDKKDTVTELVSTVKDGKITFTTDGSDYYVIAEKIEAPGKDNNVEIKEPDGGDVEISEPNPDTGDDVTITPDPDDGKVVDKVIVKDEDGNEIPVKDNGDGTYTYEQPDGDVTIEVTFKDKAPADSPQTGDNSHMALWNALLFISGGAIITLTVYDRKRRTANR